MHHIKQQRTTYDCKATQDYISAIKNIKAVRQKDSAALISTHFW